MKQRLNMSQIIRLKLLKKLILLYYYNMNPYYNYINKYGSEYNFGK